MVYFDLFISFFKIGLFSFGGGYAMIPLISTEITNRGWLLQSEFMQIIGIAEMTPGPIAVNAATFVGFKTAGFWGALSATLGVATPSLLLILFISKFFFKYSNHEFTKHIFLGIRPVIAALIFSSAILIGKESIIDISKTGIIINYKTLIIALIILVIAFRKKTHPIALVFLAGLLGFLTIFI